MNGLNDGMAKVYARAMQTQIQLQAHDTCVIIMNVYIADRGSGMDRAKHSDCEEKVCNSIG